MATRTAGRSYAANPAEVPRGTLTELFFHAVETWDGADALRERAGEEWRAISHAEVLARVQAIGAGLEGLGIKRGDRVALLSENRPEWALADYAALCIGALDVPIYATLPPHQIAYILEDSGARLVFVSSRAQLAKILEVRQDLPALERIVVFDALETAEPGVLTLAALEAEGREGGAAAAEFRARALAADPDEVCTLIYTSGTTGEPKGVMLTHDNLFSNVEATGSVVDIGSTDVALSFLPLSHVLQRMVDYLLFYHGCAIAYVGSFDLVPQALVEVGPTIVVSTPRVYEKFYARVFAATGIRRRLVLWARRVGDAWATAVLSGRKPSLSTRLRHAVADRLVFSKLRERIGGRLRYFISGGAPLSPQIAKFFYSAGVLILEGYGLTETSPVTNVNTPDSLRIGTVGKPVAGTEIMIAEDGEILVRGRQVMKGYYGSPEATAEAIDPEGWLHTGDIGEIDADGYLRITDRKKEIIVTAGGKNIAPQPVENLARASRYVSEAVMIGDRRPYPVLLVLPALDPVRLWARQNGVRARTDRELLEDPRVQTLIEQDVFKRFGELARYETPKKIAILEHELSIEQGELTPTLKVKRRVVEEHLSALIERIYEQASAVVTE